MSQEKQYISLKLSSLDYYSSIYDPFKEDLCIIDSEPFEEIKYCV